MPLPDTILCLSRAVVYGLLLLGSYSLPAQTPQAVVWLTPAQQREDLDWLRKALLYAHADLYRYQPRLVFNRRFHRLYQSADAPVEALTFFSRVAAFNARLRTNHVYTIATGPLEAQLAELSTLPLCVKALTKGLFVWRDLSFRGSIPLGSQILAINGRSARAIRQAIMPHIPADGRIKTSQKYFLHHYHRPTYQGFDLYYALYVERAASYHVRYQEYGTNAVKDITLPGITYAQKTAALLHRYQETWPFPPPAPSYELDAGNNLAILRIPRSWRLEGETRLAVVVDSLLKKMTRQRIGNLVIDIRGNPGGNDNTPAFVHSYLTRDTIS